MVTVFWPLTMNGEGKFVFQTCEERFVVDSNVNPVALVGHVTMKFVPEGMIVICGAMISGNVRLNTVPFP